MAYEDYLKSNTYKKQKEKLKQQAAAEKAKKKAKTTTSTKKTTTKTTEKEKASILEKLYAFQDQIGTGLVESLEGLEDAALDVVDWVGEKTGATDMSNFAKKAKKAARSATSSFEENADYANSDKDYGLLVGSETGQEALRSVGGMIPGIAAGTIAGEIVEGTTAASGAYNAAQVAKKAEKASKLASYAVLGSSAAGQVSRQEQENGSSLDKAMAKGILKGGVEIATEAIGDKFFGYSNSALFGETAGGELGENVGNFVASKIRNKALKNITNFMVRQGIEVSGEVAEELVGNVLDNTIDKVFGDRDESVIDWDEAKETAAATAISTIVLRGITGGFASDAADIREDNNVGITDSTIRNYLNNKAQTDTQTIKSKSIDANSTETLTQFQPTDTRVTNSPTNATANGGDNPTIYSGKVVGNSKQEEQKTEATENITSEIETAQSDGTITDEEKQSIADKIQEQIDAGNVSMEDIVDALTENSATTAEINKAVELQQQIKELEAQIEATSGVGTKKTLESKLESLKEQFTDYNIEELATKRTNEALSQITSKSEFYPSVANYFKKTSALSIPENQQVWKSDSARSTLKNLKLAGANDTDTSRQLANVSLNISEYTGEVIDFVNEPDGDWGAKFENGTITINIAKNNEGTWYSLFGHELTHAFEETDSYDEYKKLVTDYMTKTGELEEQIAKINEQYADQLSGLDEAKQQDLRDSELIADFTERLIADEEFMKSLTIDDRTTFKKMIDAIVNWFDNFLSNFTGDTKTKDDIQEIRDKFKKMYKEGKGIGIEQRAKVNAEKEENLSGSENYSKTTSEEKNNSFFNAEKTNLVTTNKSGYNVEAKDGTIRLYTNTSYDNIDSIIKNGLKTDIGRKVKEYEGNVLWFETRPDLKGYGGTTIAVDLPTDIKMDKVNDTQYVVSENVSSKNIAFIDRPLMYNYRTSDLEDLINQYGIDKVKDVFNKALENNKTSVTLEEFNELVNYATNGNIIDQQIEDDPLIQALEEKIDNLEKQVDELSQIVPDDMRKEQYREISNSQAFFNLDYDTMSQINSLVSKQATKLADTGESNGSLSTNINGTNYDVSFDLNNGSYNITDVKSDAIQGLETYTRDDIKQLTRSFINDKLIENNIDANIVDLDIHGSRNRGTANANSDLDVVVQYDGDIREDDLFNTLNEEPMYIDDVKVDINPITEDLSSYMERSRKYDKEVLNKTQYSKTTDSSGRELTKEQQSFFKDSKARDEDGNLISLYHSSRGSQFSVFDKSMGTNVEAFYFAKDRNVSSHWSTKGRNVIFDEEYNNIKEKVDNATTYQELIDIINNNNFGYKITLKDGRLEEEYDNGTSSSSYIGNNTGGNIFEVHNEYWERTTDLFDKLQKEIEEDLVRRKYTGDMYNVYLNLTNPMVVDANKSSYWQIEFEGNKVNTETLTEIAKERGYDGLIVKNVYETDYENALTDDYIAFEPEQIKLTTNTNPTSNPDIRYSKTTDNNGNELSEQQQSFFKDSQVRDDNGSLKVLYHGSDKAGFTTFLTDKSNGNYRYGNYDIIFLSDSEDVAQTYTHGEEQVDTRKITSDEDAINWLNSINPDTEYQITEEKSEWNGKTYYSVVDEYGEEVSSGWTKDELYRNLKQDYQRNFGDENAGGWYSTYANIKNPYIVDGNFNYWNDIVDENDFDSQRVIEDLNNLSDELKEKLKYLAHKSVSLSDNKLSVSAFDYFVDNSEDLYQEFIDEVGDEGITLLVSQYDLARISYMDFENDAIYEQFAKKQGTNDFVWQVLEQNEELINLYNDENGTSLSVNDENYIDNVLKAGGYDGILFKNIYDNGSYADADSSNVYVAFSSNQIKAVDNTEPTNDADIRYSKTTNPGEQSIFNILTPEITEEEQNIPVAEDYIDETYSYTTEDLDNIPYEEPYEEETEVNNNQDTSELNKKNLDDIVRNVKKELSLSKDQANNFRTEIQDMVQDENFSKEDLVPMIKKYYDNYTKVRNDSIYSAQQELRNYRIKVPDYVKLNTTDYQSIKKSLGSKVLIREDGIELDKVYQELHNSYPNLFKEQTNDIDEFEAIVEVANMDNTYLEPELYGYDYDNFLSDTADELYSNIAEAKFFQRADEAKEFYKIQPSEEDTSEVDTDYEGIGFPDDNEFEEIEILETDNLTSREKKLNKLNEQINKTAKLVDKLSEKLDYYNEKYDNATKTLTGTPLEQYLAEQSASELLKPSAKYAERFEKYSEKLQTLLDKKKALEDDIRDNPDKQSHKQIQRDLLDNTDIVGKGLDNANDINKFIMNNTDPLRLNVMVFGDKVGNLINEQIFQKVKDNESESIRFQNEQRKIIKDLGIKAGSKMSAAVQKWGEKQYVNDNGDVVPYGQRELEAEFPNIADQAKIKKAAATIRSLYEEYIGYANNVLTELGYDAIPYRKDYMRHFQELTDVFSKYGIPLNANSMNENNIPTAINGITAGFRPGKTFFASLMPRYGVKTTYDAIKGVDGYISGIANLIYHTEDIQRLRGFDNYIRETYGQEHGFDNIENLSEEERANRIANIQNNHLSNYASWLTDYTNLLAGKKSMLDRGVEQAFGRKVYSILDTANKQVGINMVGGNVSSAMTNFISYFQSLAKTNPICATKGLIDATKNIFRDDGFVEKNNFLTSRYGTQMLSNTLWQKIGNASMVFMEGTDHFVSNAIVRGKYYELKSKGYSDHDAHVEAGNFASRILGDRSKGAMPNIFGSKVFGSTLGKFQYEASNQLYSMFYDTYKESSEKANGDAVKTATGMMFTLGATAVLTHLFGVAFESVAGYNPTFDIIEAIKKMLGADDDDDSEDTALDNIIQGVESLVDQLPYISTFTGSRSGIALSKAFEGFNILDTEDDYGNKKTTSDQAKEFADSLAYWLLPTGYSQIKKTYNGLNMYADLNPFSDSFGEEREVAGSYTDSGNLRFEADTTPMGVLQSAIFGQWASQNAQDYIDSGYKTTSASDVEKTTTYGMTIDEYDNYKSGLSNYTKQADKIDYIMSTKYSNDVKTQMIYDATKKEIDASELSNYNSYEEYNYATTNPEKYKTITAITDYDTYQTYKEEITNIRNSTSNDKEETINYINSLDLTIAQKAMFIRQYYKSFKSYDNYIVEYINNMNLSYEDRLTILKELGFTISNGRAYS